MDKHKKVFEHFVEYDNLYGGYLKARKNKRYDDEVLTYTANLEENLINTQNHLIWKTYKVENLREFIEYRPKKRIITVIPFENRVVNCAAYNVLYPIYAKSFYEHSYAAIPGRGQLRAAQQLQYWMRLVQNRPEKWYLLKMDITKFFFRVPLEVQLKSLGKPLDDPDMMWFLETAIKCDGRPMGIPLDAKDVSSCERVPGIGMQVGSLISQLTANVVMTPVDNFIKRDLRVEYYARYNDDMICLVPSKEKAWEILAKVSAFLKREVGLELNSKTAVMPIDAGVEFVGRKITPAKIEMRRSSSLTMKRNLRHRMVQFKNGDITLDKALATIQSYIGLMKHCDSPELLQSVVDEWVLTREIPEEYPEEFDYSILDE